jgi:hypothetical protein
VDDDTKQRQAKEEAVDAAKETAKSWLAFVVISWAAGVLFSAPSRPVPLVLPGLAVPTLRAVSGGPAAPPLCCVDRGGEEVQAPHLPVLVVLAPAGFALKINAAKAAPDRAWHPVDSRFYFADFVASLAEEAYASLHSCLGFWRRQIGSLRGCLLQLLLNHEKYTVFEID